jgi:hypothetical protein
MKTALEEAGAGTEQEMAQETAQETALPRLAGMAAAQ